MLLNLLRRVHLGGFHLPCAQVGDLDVRLAVVEHEEVRVVADSLPRVDPRQDARLAAGPEALHHRVVDLIEAELLLQHRSAYGYGSCMNIRTDRDNV